MILLPDTLNKIQIQPASAPGTALPCVASWVGFNDGAKSLSKNSTFVAVSGTGATDLIPVGDSSEAGRQVKYISIWNNNTAQQEFDLLIDTLIFQTFFLNAQETLIYVDTVGFYKVDKYGTPIVSSGAVANKIAQLAPSAATLTDLYTVPAGKTFEGQVIVTNRAAILNTFRISIAIAGAGDATSQYIAYDAPLGENAVYDSPIIKLNATDVIRVYALLANLSFNAIGAEGA